MANKAAFRKVLKIVEKSARSRSEKNKVFDYGPWFVDRTDTHETIGDVIRHPCGTAGCIGGWGAIFEFAKTSQGRNLPLIKLDGGTGWLAALNFFEISDEEGSFLFIGNWHRDGIFASDADVIAKLKNIIKTGKVINPEFDKEYQ